MQFIETERGKEDFLSSLDLSEEQRSFLSSLITNDIISEDEQEEIMNIIETGEIEPYSELLEFKCCFLFPDPPLSCLDKKLVEAECLAIISELFKLYFAGFGIVQNPEHINKYARTNTVFANAWCKAVFEMCLINQNSFERDGLRMIDTLFKNTVLDSKEDQSFLSQIKERGKTSGTDRWRLCQIFYKQTHEKFDDAGFLACLPFRPSPYGNFGNFISYLIRSEMMSGKDKQALTELFERIKKTGVITDVECYQLYQKSDLPLKEFLHLVLLDEILSRLLKEVISGDLSWFEKIHSFLLAEFDGSHESGILSTMRLRSFFWELHAFDDPALCRRIIELELFDKLTPLAIAALGDSYESRNETIVLVLDMFFGLYRFTKKDTTDEFRLLEKRMIDTLFCFLYDRALQEDDKSYLELFTILKVSGWPDLSLFFTQNPEKEKSIIERVSRMLHAFSKMPPTEQDKLELCVVSAIDFLVKRQSIWRGLKPLFTILRKSKRPLLNADLSPEHFLARKIVNIIDAEIEESKTEYWQPVGGIRVPVKQDKRVKELYQDMANDFADYLKPAKQLRQPEDYTETERSDPGFDCNYTEPSPFWRYAYVRALRDLGVHADGQGHFFHDLLQKVSENDPSDEVKQAARKADAKLNNQRDGAAGGNYKKRFYEAFWWLRQAHLLSLGSAIDEKAARNMRIQEWR